MDHLPGGAVDGGRAWREVEAGEGEDADAFASSNLEMVGGLYMGANLQTVGDIGIVASLLGAVGIVIAIADGYVDGFAIG